MPIENQPFVRTKLDEEQRSDTFTIKLNAEERKWLEEMKQIIEQEKDSTAIKQLAYIGAKVLLEPKTTYILETIFDNKRKNKRLGIGQFEAQFYAKVLLLPAIGDTFGTEKPGGKEKA